jgi:hypothetical protein
MIVVPGVWTIWFLVEFMKFLLNNSWKVKKIGLVILYREGGREGDRQ